MDLYAAIIVVFALCTAGFGLGWAVRRRGLVIQIVAGIAAFAVAVLYLSAVRDAAWVTRVLPVSAVAVYTNPLPVVAGFLAGMLWANTKTPAWRRGVLAAILLAFGWESPTRLVFPQTPPTRTLWSDGVCIQTTSATCTPAAAATLLHHHGIETTEAEMAELCLTGANGTHLFGLFRGLLQQADGTHWRPRIEAMRFETFRDRPELLPAVVSVRLDQAALDRDPRYQEQWGWTLGVTHSIVVFGFTDDGRVEIGDPGAGREHWSVGGLRDLWADEVAWLVRREP